MPNIILWILSAIFAALGILNGRHFSSIFLILAAIVSAPIPIIKKLFSYLSNTQIIPMLVSFLIVFCGISFYPALSKGTVTATSSETEQIIITNFQIADSSISTSADRTDFVSKNESKVSSNDIPSKNSSAGTTSKALESSSPDIAQSSEVSQNKPNTAPLKIEVISLTSPIGRGNTATLEIKGVPNTTYSIAVYYSKNKSSAKGLETKTSDEKGLVSWSWRVGSRTKEGTHKIVVTSGGKEQEIKFIVE